MGSEDATIRLIDCELVVQIDLNNIDMPLLFESRSTFAADRVRGFHQT